LSLLLFSQLTEFLLPGKIKIQDILACGFLDDLLEVGHHFNIGCFLLLYLSLLFVQVY